MLCVCLYVRLVCLCRVRCKGRSHIPDMDYFVSRCRRVTCFESPPSPTSRLHTVQSMCVSKSLCVLYVLGIYTFYGTYACRNNITARKEKATHTHKKTKSMSNLHCCLNKCEFSILTIILYKTRNF